MGKKPNPPSPSWLKWKPDPPPPKDRHQETTEWLEEWDRRLDRRMRTLNRVTLYFICVAMMPAAAVVLAVLLKMAF